jgi:site-specific DNA recombinase
MNIIKENAGGGPALVYCRISTKGLAKGTSLKSQRAACAAHAERLGYAIARVTEEIYSGAELFARPQLSRDRADIRTGRFKAVIAYSVDRLTRNAAHLSIFSDECDRAGCRLIFVTEDSAASTSLRSDEAFAAEVERDSIRERMSRGRRFKLAQGRPIINSTWHLYGYRPDEESEIYRIYEPEAEVVRRVFSLCAAGKGMHRTAATFNREGVPSPKSAWRQGARWTSSAISDMLNNPSYVGEEYRLKMTQGATGRKIPRPASERVRLPEGVRPPIVPRELWEECQRGIRARAAKMNNQRERPSLLRGHIFCAECGAHMIRTHFERGKYKYIKYRCGSRWRPYDMDCRGVGSPGEVVEEWVWEKVESMLSDGAFVARALESVERRGYDPQLASDIQSAKRAHDRCGVVLQALTENSALGPYVERAAAQAARERQQLEKVIAELEAKAAAAGRRAEELRRLTALAGAELTFEDRRLALWALGVRVYANGTDPASWRYEVNV